MPKPSFKLIRRIVDRRRHGGVRNARTQTSGDRFRQDNIIRANGNLLPLPGSINRQQGSDGGASASYGGNASSDDGGNVSSADGASTSDGTSDSGDNCGDVPDWGAENQDHASAPPSPNAIDLEQQPEENPWPVPEPTPLAPPPLIPIQVAPVIHQPQVLISLALVPVNNVPSVFLPLLIRETTDPVDVNDPLTVFIQPMCENPVIPSTSNANVTVEGQVPVNTTFTMAHGNFYVQAVQLNDPATVPNVEATEPAGIEADDYAVREINNNTIYAQRLPADSSNEDAPSQMFVSEGYDPAFINQAFGPLFPDEVLEPDVLNGNILGDEAPVQNHWYNPAEPQPGPSQAAYFMPNDDLLQRPPSPNFD